MQPRNPESFLNNKERAESVISEHEPALVDTENSPSKKLLEKETKEAIEKALAILSPRERKIIQLHLGFDGVAEHTFEEIAEKYKITPQRTGQIEAAAMKKLLKYLNESGFSSSSFGEIDDSHPYSVDRRFELESLYQQLVEMRQRIDKKNLELQKKEAGLYVDNEFHKLKQVFFDKKNSAIEEFKKTLELLKEEIKKTEQEIKDAENAIKAQNSRAVELKSPVSVTYLIELQETYKKQIRRRTALEEMLKKISSPEFRK